MSRPRIKCAPRSFVRRLVNAPSIVDTRPVSWNKHGGWGDAISRAAKAGEKARRKKHDPLLDIEIGDEMEFCEEED